MKEELEKYNDYKFELSILKNKLNQIEREREEEKISGSNFEINGDIRAKGYISNKAEDQIINNIDKTKELRNKIKELEEKIEIVDEALKTLKNNDRIAVELYFLEKVSFISIANTLGLADDRKAQRKVADAIKKMDKIYTKYEMV